MSLIILLNVLGQKVEVFEYIILKYPFPRLPPFFMHLHSW